MSALLLAVRDSLKTSLSYTEAQCEVGWDGRPHPKAGQVFVAVHPGGIREEYVEGRADVYNLTVTLSMRIGQLPVDRVGKSLVVLATTGLYDRAHAIAACLHRNTTVMSDANTTIGGSANGFCEALRFLSMSIPQQQGPEWWWAEDDANPPVGLSIAIEFGECRRFQTYESQA